MKRWILPIVCAALLAGCSGGDNGSPPSHAPGTPTAQGKLLPVESTVTLYAADAKDSGSALAVGDFNGDGVQDVAFAAAFGDGPDNQRQDAGEVYVFFGPFRPGETRDAAAGQQDLTIYGAGAGDQAGRGLAAGDFNGDGIDDIIIGAPFAAGPNGEKPQAGAVYVIPGSHGLGQGSKTIDLRDGAPLTVYGGAAGDLTGFAVASAHLNADAAADLIIGAFWSGGPDGQRSKAGAVYVVYGSSQATRTVDIAAGQQDVTVYGAAPGDRLGEGVAAGDVNGDGFDDLVLPAPFASSLSGKASAGRTYVIYSPAPPKVDLASDSVNSVIYGVDEGDQFGHVTVVGDVDGDGRADILVTAVSADGPDNTVNLSGEAALILGKSLSAQVDIAAGGEDVHIYGADAEDRMGRSAAMGDIDGDGHMDLLLGAPGGGGADESKPSSGEMYVIFGPQVPKTLRMPEGALVYYGQAAGDNLASEVFGRLPLQAADVNHDGRAEILVAAPAANGPDGTRTGCGEALILFTPKDVRSR